MSSCWLILGIDIESVALPSLLFSIFVVRFVVSTIDPSSGMPFVRQDRIALVGYDLEL